MPAQCQAVRSGSPTLLPRAVSGAIAAIANAIAITTGVRAAIAVGTTGRERKRTS